MDNFTATELAYKNGYSQGMKDAVKHGDWEKQDGIYSCSVCGKACPYQVEDGVIYYWHCEFCPHCGAKMDGGE